jgi:hypothetical protein
VREKTYGGYMADDRMSGNEMRQRLSWGGGMAIGMGAGVALGATFDNMAVGIGLGIAAGVAFVIAIGSIGKRRKPSVDDEGPDRPDSAG